ncbi:MAG TPA: xanthine dehydrogenase family protein molybdopterin-binding subunit [Bacillota bacterium]|nr:xanthine dehydrogenase family protein molybdopterin-binding subunit [Bacillota bacterium]
MARIDGIRKATGAAIYAADVQRPGMLVAAVVRSPFPSARIKSIDTSEARAMPGVHAVLTGEDVGPALFGRRVRDVPVLAQGIVRYVGEAVAAVAAEDRPTAERAAAAVRVEYEPLPAVLTPEEAWAPGAPRVHDAPWSYEGAVVKPEDPGNLQSRVGWQNGGDVDQALAQSAHTVDLVFTTPAQHQGYIEPQACVCEVGRDGRTRVWAANKSPYRLREQLTVPLGLSPERYEVRPVPVGGDFGGKGAPMDVPLCAALARASDRPVKLARRYSEDLMAANPAHASRTRVRAGCDADGRITALDVHLEWSGGAYAGYKPVPTVNLHGAHGAGSSYRIPAIRIESLVAYTHTVPGGHRRAPGAPQTVFAVESALDELARVAGLDPVAFRRANLLREGDATPLGDRYAEVRGVETLDAAMAAYRPVPAPAGMRHGMGIALYDRGTGIGRSSMALRAEAGGGVTAFVSFPENGAGAHTAVQTLVARGLGLQPAQVAVEHLSTDELPPDDGVGGSRVTASIGELVARAVAAYQSERPEPGQSVTATLEPGGTRRVTAFAVQIAQVAIDPETGRVQPLHILSAHDVAEVVNPLAHEVQIEGGVAMGLSNALLEDLAVVDGRVTAANLGDFKLASQRDVPPIEVVLVPGGLGVGAGNVKGIGEMGNVAVLAALANAVRDALGARVCALPITSEAVYRVLHGEAGQ